jgi:peptidoglycan hydrolase CwlO-like protein
MTKRTILKRQITLEEIEAKRSKFDYEIKKLEEQQKDLEEQQKDLENEIAELKTEKISDILIEIRKKINIIDIK